MTAVETWLGIALGTSATLAFNYCPILQKSAVDEMQEISLTRNIGPSLRALLTSREWMLGALLAILGGIPYMMALNLVGISVLQPLMSLGLLVIVYFGVMTLGERLGPWEIAGIALMILMPFFLHAAAVTNIQVNLLEPRALAPLLLFSVSLCVSVVIIVVLDRLALSGRVSWLLWALATGLAFALGATLGQAMLAFLGAGSVIGALASTLLALLSTLFAVFIFQIALQKGAATRVGPINHSVNVLVAVTGGIVVFGQEIGSYPLYALAIVCTVVGTGLLGRYEGAGGAVPVGLGEDKRLGQ